MSKRNKPQRRKINPHYWVFCEGKTEEAYVAFLRSFFRVPVEIVSRVSGSGIDLAHIKKFKQGKPTDKKDKNFLVYDGDVEAVVKRLKTIPGCTVLLSNPSIELWFLYHFKNQKANITTAQCIKELENRTRTRYAKGEFCDKLEEKFKTKLKDAIAHSKASDFSNNPSSNMHELLEEFMALK